MADKKTPALSAITLLECIWTDCPKAVVDDARRLWGDREYGNDHFYHSWSDKYANDEGGDATNYPAIAKYLKDHGIKDCLIHWWW